MPPDPAIKCRSLRSSDVSLIYQRQLLSKPLPDVEWFVKRAVKTMEQRRGDCVLVYDMTDTDLIGIGLITYWLRSGEISDLYVVPSKRSSGIGTAIIQRLIASLRQTPLHTAEIGAALSNPRALNLYRKLGFVDKTTRNIDLGNGIEPVLYLELSW